MTLGEENVLILTRRVVSHAGVFVHMICNPHNPYGAGFSGPEQPRRGTAIARVLHCLCWCPPWVGFFVKLGERLDRARRSTTGERHVDAESACCLSVKSVGKESDCRHTYGCRLQAVPAPSFLFR